MRQLDNSVHWEDTVSKVLQPRNPAMLGTLENIREHQVTPNALSVIQVNTVLVMVLQKIAQQVIGALEQR